MKGNTQESRGAIGNRGFTLVELLITTLIAATLAAVSLPSFIQWREGVACRTAARDVVSMLREARSTALATNREHRVEFQKANNRYGLRAGDRAHHTNWTDVPRVAAWKECPPAVQLSSNIASIQYNTNGTANGGTITIQDRATGKRYDIIVNRTGRIHIR